MSVRTLGWIAWVMLTGACDRDDARAPTPATSSAAASVETPAPDRLSQATGVPPGDSGRPHASTAAQDEPAQPTTSTVTIIDVDAQAGPLDAQLAAVAARAKKEQRPIAVELWASWCPPCKTFDKLIDSGQLDAALSGTMLVRVDVDMFNEELNELGFKAPQIPSLYHVDGRGRPTGKPLSGASWHKRGAPEISAALTTFLASP